MAPSEQAADKSIGSKAPEKQQATKATGKSAPSTGWANTLTVAGLVLRHLVESHIMGSPRNFWLANFQGAAPGALQEASETQLVVLSGRDLLKRIPSIETIKEMFKGVAM